jgi:hypothetical protein
VVLIVGGRLERKPSSTCFWSTAVIAAESGSSGASAGSGEFQADPGPKKRPQSGGSSRTGAVAVRGLG